MSRVTNGHFPFDARGASVGHLKTEARAQCPCRVIKIAKKIWRYNFLAIFCSKKGVWGEAGFVRPSVVSGKTRTFRIAKKGQVAKKNETADDGGGSVSPRPTARYPNPRPRPTPPTAKYGIAKNGELLGPKVKGRMGYSKANI